jgi:hypothetical protein
MSLIINQRTWHPTFKGLLSKKRLEKSHDPVDPKKIYQVQKHHHSKTGLRFFSLQKQRERILKRKGDLAMSRSLSKQKDILYMSPETQKL